MSTFKQVMLYLLAFCFIGAGLLHFWIPEKYERIMPPYLPWPMFLQYMAGVFEIVFAIMILIPRYRRLGAWGLVLLLIAVFPANVYMALNPNLFLEFPSWAYWVRLPLQLPLIAWAWWFTRENKM